MKSLSRLSLNGFYALLAIAMFSTGIASATGVSPFLVGAIGTGLSFLTPSMQGVAFAGINKEMWLPDLLEGFYADDMFLSEVRDMSAFVDNDKINLAEAGVNPAVLINNTGDVSTAQRTDINHSYELETYDTENTLVKDIEIAELSYDKVSSILYGHRQALRMKFMQKAIHAYAPASNTTNTPVIAATGADDGAGFKRLTFQDILALATKFDEAEIPQEGRCLVLSAKHKNQLREQDLTLYNTVFNHKSTVMMYGGFKIFSLASTRMPVYNKTTGVKAAFGAAAASATDTYCSVAFHKDEVMKADGSVTMFEDLRNPTKRGDILGFQKRALARPLRDIGVAAIYSPAV